MLHGFYVVYRARVEQLKAECDAQVLRGKWNRADLRVAHFKHERHLEVGQERFVVAGELTFEKEADVLADATAEEQRELIRELPLATIGRAFACSLDTVGLLIAKLEEQAGI